MIAASTKKVLSVIFKWSMISVFFVGFMTPFVDIILIVAEAWPVA